ncbi:MAG: GIY-YIG nuclease family protein [Bacteroidia bacterium]
MPKIYHNYYVYIVTNPAKEVVYIGFTNNLLRRVFEHRENKGNPSTFAGKYHCYNLVYYEWFRDVNVGISREKELKRWSREKKEALINRVNPDWTFVSEIENEHLLHSICGNNT